jgi:hypothetical protein
MDGKVGSIFSIFTILLDSGALSFEQYPLLCSSTRAWRDELLQRGWSVPAAQLFCMLGSRGFEEVSRVVSEQKVLERHGKLDQIRRFLERNLAKWHPPITDWPAPEWLSMACCEPRGSFLSEAARSMSWAWLRPEERRLGIAAPAGVALGREQHPHLFRCIRSTGALMSQTPANPPMNVAFDNGSGELLVMDDNSGGISFFKAEVHADSSVGEYEAEALSRAEQGACLSDGRGVSMAMGAGGRRLLIGHHDKWLRMWEREESGKWKMFGWWKSLHTESLTWVALSEDGGIGCSGGWPESAHVFEILSDDEERKVKPLIQVDGYGRIWGVALSRRGDIMACGGDDGFARVFDISSRASADFICKVGQGVGAVQTLALDWEGTMLATGGEDGHVRVWEIAGVGEGEARSDSRGRGEERKEGRQSATLIHTLVIHPTGQNPQITRRNPQIIGQNPQASGVHLACRPWVLHG